MPIPKLEFEFIVAAIVVPPSAVRRIFAVSARNTTSLAADPVTNWLATVATPQYDFGTALTEMYQYGADAISTFCMAVNTFATDNNATVPVAFGYVMTLFDVAGVQVNVPVTPALCIMI